MRNWNLCLRTLLAATLLLASRALSGGIAIGGFDAARGDALSIQDGIYLDTLRSAIQDAFPTATITTSQYLTSDYLAGVDVVLLSSIRNGSEPIVPLTTDERGALIDFVKGGGTAILFADNGNVGGYGQDSANWSLIAPFEFTTEGTGLGGFAKTTQQHPITDGPFGTVDGIVPVDSAYIATYPAAAILLGKFPDGKVALAVLDPGAIGQKSGMVVVSCDASLIFDGPIEESAIKLVLNALATVQPSEPCYADCTQDKSLDLFDFLCYVGAFNIGLDMADCDGSGALDVFDFLCFVNAFNAGC